MIIQMQDAVFSYTGNSLPMDFDYDDGQTAYATDGSDSTDIGFTGLYEFATVASFTSGSLTLNAGLTHSYYAGTDANGFKQTFQVMWVSRYSDLALTGDITPQAWDGSAGGIVALDVLGTLDFAGFAVNAAGSDIAGDPVGPSFRPGVYVGGASGGKVVLRTASTSNACDYADENGYSAASTVHKVDRADSDLTLSIGSLVDYEATITGDKA